MENGISKIITLVKEYESNQESIKTLTSRNHEIARLISQGKLAKGHRSNNNLKGSLSGISLAIIELMQDGKIRTAREIAQKIEGSEDISQKVCDKYCNAVSKLKRIGKLSVIGKAKWNKSFRLRYSPKPKKVEEKSIEPKQQIAKLGDDTRVVRINQPVQNPSNLGGFGMQ